MNQLATESSILGHKKDEGSGQRCGRSETHGRHEPDPFSNDPDLCGGKGYRRQHAVQSADEESKQMILPQPPHQASHRALLIPSTIRLPATS
jgi:hypothetical protein